MTLSPRNQAGPGLGEVVESIDFAAAGARMHGLAARLYPICRSITGPGLRETLLALGETIPLTLTEVPSGTQAFDWTIPKEWTVREAWIKGPSGAKVIDFASHNLHLMSYSVPVRARMPLSELRPRLHSLPAQPDRIHWRAS
jgi:aminopeptidase-like protein